MAVMHSLSFSLSSSSDPQPVHNHHHQRQPFTLSPSNKKRRLLSLPSTHRFNPKPHSFSSQSSPTTYSCLEDSFKPGRFLSNEELENLRTLQDFTYYQELKTGSMWVRVMRPEDMDITVKLLAESFVESMLLPVGYLSLLRFLAKQYLIERRAVLPHAVTLVGFYREKEKGQEEEEEEEELAGTVELCFDKRGANTSTPTPTPPKDSPFICNMAVKKPLRRRGIGWNLLKASEELISQMSNRQEVYLHCRIIDSAPFNMYTKAGYKIIKTDSILILLMLQRRKHLMCKKLPGLNNCLEFDMLESNAEHSSEFDMQNS